MTSVMLRKFMPIEKAIVVIMTDVPSLSLKGWGCGRYSMVMAVHYWGDRFRRGTSSIQNMQGGNRGQLSNKNWSTWCQVWIPKQYLEIGSRPIHLSINSSKISWMFGRSFYPRIVWYPVSFGSGTAQMELNSFPKEIVVLVATSVVWGGRRRWRFRRKFTCTGRWYHVIQFSTHVFLLLCFCGHWSCSAVCWRRFGVLSRNNGSYHQRFILKYLLSYILVGAFWVLTAC